MIATKHTQSLTDFRQKATETLARLNQSGMAEILTVNGEARAVLMSPTAYDELTREAEQSRDIAVIRQAIQEIEEGKGQEADTFFEGLKAQLLGMKTRRPKRKAK